MDERALVRAALEEARQGLREGGRIADWKLLPHSSQGPGLSGAGVLG